MKGLSVLGMTACASLMLARGTFAILPDGRGYELVSPVEKNGVTPYGAIPAPSGVAVDFQALGPFAGVSWGSLNLYQASRGPEGWQTVPLTPKPPLSAPLGALEQQVPVWTASDLSEAIFTTPEPYAAGDEDRGSLSLYLETSYGQLTWLSQGVAGGGEPKQVTFDGATSDGRYVVFSSGAALMPEATGLNSEASPEPEFLYERDVATGETSVVNLDVNDRPAGSAATTLAADFAPGGGSIRVIRTPGFFPGQFVKVGAGASAETTQIFHVEQGEGLIEKLEVGNIKALGSAHLTGEPVVHASEGAILGDGGHLTAGQPPAGEFLPANTGSGSTTNAVSSDGAKVFFESPSPGRGEPVGLYMRENNATTVAIAGAKQYGTTISGLFGEEEPVFGSARFEAAASDGSLIFFSTEEGLFGAAADKELYEFNATGHVVGGIAPLSVSPISTGSSGDQAPLTSLAAAANFGDEAISVASTAGFVSGEAIAFAPFEVNAGRHTSTVTAVVAAVTSATELRLTVGVNSIGLASIPAGTVIHGVHPASLVAAANDGEKVYFESNGVLAANVNSSGSAAVAGKPNLYVFDTAQRSTTFVATLAASDVSTEGNAGELVGEPDVSRPAVPSPDGGVLVFLSAGNLTDQNSWEEYREVYRYSVSDDSLACLSCTAPGVRPTGDASFGETAGGTYDPPGLSAPMSEDGRQVFFDTPDSLVPGDVNAGVSPSAEFASVTATDVYEWSVSGGVDLISSGRSLNPAMLQGTTPSGNDVLFRTTAQLVPQGADGGFENVFDARVGGGFSARTGGGQPSCVGEACQAAFGIAPVSVVPGSTGPQEAGHRRAVAREGKTCRNGRTKRRVKRRVVCVRKKASRANRARGGFAHNRNSRRRNTVRLG